MTPKFQQRQLEALAQYLGGVLATAHKRGGEWARTFAYQESYEPLVAILKADNPKFDQVRFAAAVGKAEMAVQS